MSLLTMICYLVSSAGLLPWIHGSSASCHTCKRQCCTLLVGSHISYILARMLYHPRGPFRRMSRATSSVLVSCCKTDGFLDHESPFDSLEGST
ncbi:hypothetical protein BV25DRAFT_637697 [Artomyces pyxidatus]|uniref:Uncharacterized protein n=1 Tax=Artomyces pyxidatus TaxID=48021 RepID=A0ACB8T175_9AGAM|nr:hypothetical protein BV25DRAFT_637697 [Artomyces pyxidatus]